MAKYAQRLLGLSDAWALALFNFPSWPHHWLDENVTPVISDRIRNDTIFVRPTAEQAVYVLRRLADQFEEEQGANENAIHTTISHFELVEIE